MGLQVLVADQCPLVQQSIRTLVERLSLHIVGEAHDGDEAIRLATTCEPDVVVLDQSMSSLNGIEAARAIHERRPNVHLILLTSTVTEPQVAAAFRAGIRGCVLKADIGNDLVRAIHTVVMGGTFLSPGVSRVFLDANLPPRMR